LGDSLGTLRVIDFFEFIATLHEAIMESAILKEMISVIRAEQQRRESLLTDEGPDSYYIWCFENESVINELCLMLLVTLRHQVERELVQLAALAVDDGQEISHQHYYDRVKELRKGIGWNWKEIKERLNLKFFEECQEYKSVEALRLLANSYKHDLSVEPAEDLKEFLDLPKVSYAPLPESDLFREKLATFIGLERKTLYCDITERFIDVASAFLEKVERQTNLDKVKLEAGLIDDFAH